MLGEEAKGARRQHNLAKLGTNILVDLSPQREADTRTVPIVALGQDGQARQAVVVGRTKAKTTVELL